MATVQGTLKTRVFEIAEQRGMNLYQLAKAMHVDYSLVWRIHKGQRSIGRSFMTGAKRAFPTVDFGYLFYVDEDVA